MQLRFSHRSDKETDAALKGILKKIGVAG